MNIKELNQDLSKLTEKINHLATIPYSDSKYDEVEEELHELEDDFLSKHGDQLEEVLNDVHERDFPESDVLSPIAYLAKKYVVKTTHSNGNVDYIIPAKNGVWVEAFALPNKDVRLVLLPNPPRLVMHYSGQQKDVWNASGEHAKA